MGISGIAFAVRRAALCETRCRYFELVPEAPYAYLLSEHRTSVAAKVASRASAWWTVGEYCCAGDVHAPEAGV